MKICLLTHGLNPRTGVGEFSNNLITSVKSTMPESEFSILTSEDVLRPEFVSMIKNWFYIRQKIRESEIVHAIDAYPYGAIAALANFFINRPLIITAIGTGSLQLFNRSGWKSMLFRWAYLRASHITAISRYVARGIELNVKNAKVEVVNPGIDYDYWPIIQATSIDDRLKELQPYVLSVGELKRRKGYDIILSIMSSVFKVRPNAKYVIVANTRKNIDYRDKLNKQIEELGIKDKVIMISDLSRESLRSVYQHSSLYVALPQNVDGDVEGFGIAVMEAAASGTPAVVGKGSGADDTVANEQSGFLVDGKNKKVVLEKILSVIDNKELREQLSKGAQKWASENNLESKAKQYIDIYEKI